MQIREQHDSFTEYPKGIATACIPSSIPILNTSGCNEAGKIFAIKERGTPINLLRIVGAASRQELRLIAKLVQRSAVALPCGWAVFLYLHPMKLLETIVQNSKRLLIVPVDAADFECALELHIGKKLRTGKTQRPAPEMQAAIEEWCKENNVRYLYKPTTDEYIFAGLEPGVRA